MILLFWFLFGFIPASIHLYLDWYKGFDIDIGDICGTIMVGLFGQIAGFVIFISYLDNIKYNVVFRGRKEKQT